jgi:glutathione S-transferase
VCRDLVHNLLLLHQKFGAPLADPYAAADVDVQPAVDAALRVICSALLEPSLPVALFEAQLQALVPADKVSGVTDSLVYLRDRVGVPRDLPLASARYLRAYLNWAVDTLTS